MTRIAKKKQIKLIPAAAKFKRPGGASPVCDFFKSVGYIALPMILDSTPVVAKVALTVPNVLEGSVRRTTPRRIGFANEAIPSRIF